MLRCRSFTGNSEHWQRQTRRRVCVDCLFLVKVTEPSPLQDSSSVRQIQSLKGRPTRTPPLARPVVFESQAILGRHGRPYI